MKKATEDAQQRLSAQKIKCATNGCCTEGPTQKHPQHQFLVSSSSSSCALAACPRRCISYTESAASVSKYGSFQVGRDWRVADGCGLGFGAEMMDVYCGGSVMVDIDGAGEDERDDEAAVLVVGVVVGL